MKRLYSLLITVSSITSFAQTIIPFTNEISPSFGNTTVKYDPRLFNGDYSSNTDMLDILALSGDCTVYDRITNKFSPMKGNISNIYVFPNGTNESETDSSATIYASFDKNEKNPNLGDGGGVVFFKIAKTKGTNNWKVVPITKIGTRFAYFQNVDFSANDGGTVNNRDFIFTGRGEVKRVLVTENIESIKSNKDLIGFADTSDYEYPASATAETNQKSVVPEGTTLKKYLSLGWPTEIDLLTGEVISKVHRLGRGASSITKYRSEYIFVYPGNPSVLMQYIPFTGSQPSSSSTFEDPEYDSNPSPNLFAYKQNPDGTGSFSIPIAFKKDSIPDSENPGLFKSIYTQLFDSLLVAKEVALRAGATMFANIGDIAVTYDAQENPVILITEKGIDNTEDMYNNPSKKFSGVLANHLKELDKKDLTENGVFSDPYGRVLSLKTNTGIKIFTEGGVSNGNKFFSNPDKIEISDELNNQTDVRQLNVIIKENIPATDKGRNLTAVPFNERINEAYSFQLLSDGFQSNYLPVENNEVAPMPFSNYKLIASGSKGSMLSSSNKEQILGNVFLRNSKAKSELKLESYVSVINGYNGTDKSMIVVLNRVNKGLPDIELSLNSEMDYNAANGLAWPNPTTGMLQVKEASDYTVTDMSGNQLLSFTNTQTLDLTNLNKGMYFLKKANGKVQKIILQ